MGHIFISYSHKDTTYAHGLADHLRNMGFDIWMDERLDYGSQWPHELQKRLDSCSAFIVIMSPRSFASEWVQSELQRAKRKAKPVFPLLLEGEEPWLSVESTQYYDVRDRRLPGDEFFSDLRQAVSSKMSSQPQIPVIKVEPVKNTPPGGRKNMGLFAAGGNAAIFICLLMGVLLFQQMADKVLSPFVPTGTGILTAQSNTTSPVTLPSTAISSIPTLATTIVLPVELPDGSDVRIFNTASGNEYRYNVLSAQREGLPQNKYLLRLRVRAWNNAGSINFWSDSFRLVAGDITLAPVNKLNLVARRNETVDGDVEFEIDASLKEAILKITLYNNVDWATNELRLVFP